MCGYCGYRTTSVPAILRQLRGVFFRGFSKIDYSSGPFPNSDAGASSILYIGTPLVHLKRLG